MGEMMQKYTAMCADGEIPSDYEFLLTVLGHGEMDNFGHQVPEPMLQKLRDALHIKSDKFGNVLMPALIVGWMLYTNKAGAAEEFDEQWFNQFEKHVGLPFYAS